MTFAKYEAPSLTRGYYPKTGGSDGARTYPKGNTGLTETESLSQDKCISDDLMEIANVWSELSGDLKTAVLAIVRSFCGKSKKEPASGKDCQEG